MSKWLLPTLKEYYVDVKKMQLTASQRYPPSTKDPILIRFENIVEQLESLLGLKVI